MTGTDRGYTSIEICAGCWRTGDRTALGRFQTPCPRRDRQVRGGDPA